MMLKVDNTFLDFNDDVQMERQVKLFEDIEATTGDFSYSFNLPKTARNIAALSRPFPDNIDKLVYQTIPSELCGNDGITIYRGSIRIERISNVFECSFFSGNTNWYAMLVGNMTDLDLSAYDIEQTSANITGSYSNEDGIIFPLIDTGVLSTRSYHSAKVEDFTPCFFVRTLFKEVFQQSGLKIAGGFLKDYLYNNTIIAANGRSKQQIDDRTAFVEKTTPQTIPASTDPSEIVTFDNDSVHPYFDGPADNFSLVTNRYTADVGMILKIQYTFNYTVTGFIGFVIYLNGNPIQSDVFGGSLGVATQSYIVRLQAGDYIEILTRALGIASSGTVDSGNVRFTPTFVYNILGSFAVPFWTKQQFVSNILRMFNVVPTFDPFTKTVTFELFESIKNKEPIDISPYVTIESTDYAEFINEYGRTNNFRYQENDTENLQEYNITTFVKYGAGVINVDNDFIEESVDVIEVDFSSPVSYQNLVFGASMERINFVELEDNDKTEFGSVSDSSGVAQFNVGDDIFLQDDLVRVEDSSEEYYNGEWVVSNVGSGTIRLRGVDYNGTATGTITRLSHKVSTSDDVFIFVSVGRYLYSKYGSKTGFYINNGFSTFVAPAYFSLLALGNTIESEYTQSLSFGRIEDPLFFQRTILEMYWKQFERILNDPVKPIGSAHFPLKVYEQLDFLRPVTIKTLETTNLYYVNRITGYEGRQTACTIELIKLP